MVLGEVEEDLMNPAKIQTTVGCAKEQTCIYTILYVLFALCLQGVVHVGVETAMMKSCQLMGMHRHMDVVIQHVRVIRHSDEFLSLTVFLTRTAQGRGGGGRGGAAAQDEDEFLDDEDDDDDDDEEGDDDGEFSGSDGDFQAVYPEE